MAKKKTTTIAEFGDFQTPLELARLACGMLRKKRFGAASIVEPTCGKGSFLKAAMEQFPDASRILGLDINKSHLDTARQCIADVKTNRRVELLHADFFATDWPDLLSAMPEPILVVGNPPWVTNAELGVLGSSNLPVKSNFQKHGGFDALTGKSNFDISEWMIIKLLEWLDGKDAAIGMLCKTAVARKAVQHAWKNNLRVRGLELHKVDAGRFFDAAVDACFFVGTMSRSTGRRRYDCAVFEDVGSAIKTSTFGIRDGLLVADVEQYDAVKALRGESAYRWRSGVKHDCSRVMEFTTRDGRLFNGLDEPVDIESDYLFPMLKTSELGHGDMRDPDRFMLVTQRTVGESTDEIEVRAPRTWKYLADHAAYLDARRSAIYRQRPRFSVFGVGEYTFAPWKVAISGFYKRLCFKVLGTAHGKPIVLDDASYFIACRTGREAVLLAELLNGATATTFLSAFVFWDNKRPITAGLLRHLDLQALAIREGRGEDYGRHCLTSPR